jgi:diguanylate cyclase (GGDEF)-like protein/PAS domain S-box-containing protein
MNPNDMHPVSSHAPEVTATRMHALLERAPLAMAFTRGDQFEVVSEHLKQLFHCADGECLSGRTLRAVHASEAAFTGQRERLSQAFAQGKPVDEEVEFVRRDGSRFWGRLQATPVGWDNPSGDALWVIEDITQARQTRLQPTWVGRHDPVTELANRREFERRLAEHVGSRRLDPVSVLWVDIDHFDDLIQRFGQEAADHFLFAIGQLLLSKVRATDILARLEDDHFAVLLPNCDHHYAQIVGEKMRSTVAGYRLRWGKDSTKTKVCVGVAQLHPSLQDAQAVLDAASVACDEGKAAGGDSVRVYVPAALTDTQMADL